MTRSLCFCVFLLLVFRPATGQDAASSPDFSTYEGRKAAVIESFRDADLRERGKHGIPRALARIHCNPKDAVAWEYLGNVLEPRQQTMFDFPGIALAYCQYGRDMPYEQMKKINAYLSTLDTKAKSATGGEGFLGHGTENHALMMWAGAYLIAQERPDLNWSNGLSSEELMAVLKERMRRMLKNVYRMGYAEYLSTTYDSVLNLSMEILMVYAKDPEVRAMAEAYMLYKWSILSLNVFDGDTIAPYARMNTQIDHDTQSPKEKEVAGSSYYNWVLWGWGPATNNVDLLEFHGRQEGGYNESSPAVYAALSKAVPDEVFFRIAASKEPITHWSSTCMFGGYGAGAPRWMLRKVHREKNFAIGTGNFRWVPGGDYADHDAAGFSISWTTADRYNYMNCYSPYWYSDGEERGPDTWDHGHVSPFQQTALHENTAITLFDIPDKDPWPEQSDQGKWKWRDAHADNLLKRGMLRYPKSVDEEVEQAGWIFLREGDTYIGIKPLKDYYVERDFTDVMLKDFVVVKSDHARTGFLFELSTKEESGDFADFRKRLSDNAPVIDWDTLAVSYKTLRGAELSIRYVPGLPVVPVLPAPMHWDRHNKSGGLAESVPIVTINGVQERFLDGWPMIESPVIRMNNSVLRIDDGKTRISVDWQETWPVIRRN